MSKVAPDLEVVAKLLVNVRFRDQSIKLVQYVLKLVHPFFSRQKPSDSEDLILHAQQMLSNGRKAFRLFKSINSLSKLFKTSMEITDPKSSLGLDRIIIKIISMFEDCLWVSPRYLVYTRSHC
jgi:hypothetical protein